MTKSIQFNIDQNLVANLVFDLPNEKVNKLSSSVLMELEQILDQLAENKEVKLLVIYSAKAGNFIAGADINEIKEIKTLSDSLSKVSVGQNILDKIAQLKIPTIAIINGSCLGGGLELALACTYRIAVISDKTKIGLPEVNLGIIPGFGGTQRLPALVGIEQSLNLILSGKAIDATKSFKIGLVDQICHSEFLAEVVEKFISEVKENDKNQYLAIRNQRAKKRKIIEFFTKNIIFYLAEKNLLTKTKGNYPAPIEALKVIKKTYQKTNIKNGLKIELDHFSHLAISDVSKNLIQIFFTSEALKKDNGSEINFDKKEIKNAALVGAGVMGGGIAWLFSNFDIAIRVKDISLSSIAIGYNQVLKVYGQLKKIKKYTQNQIDIKIAKISSTTDFSGFKQSEIVIEAVVENIDVKKQVIAEIEKNVSDDCLIVSNTSSLSISQMAKGLKKPERFAGMHFFNPVNKMPLVEVIRGEKTSDETIANIVNLAKKLNKTPIVVSDSAGFLVNRILLPYMNEAVNLIVEGASITQVDEVIEKFGMPMGPFILADIVGIDVGYKVAKTLFDSFGERMEIAKLLQEIHLNHKDLLGKKSNQGFYLYHKKGSKNVNHQIDKLIVKIRKENSIKISLKKDQEIIERCIYLMINEAAKCLEEKVVANAAYLDMAMIMGAGFPAFRGGILRYADKIGIDKIVERLEKLSINHTKFKAADLLIEMAKNNQKFYN
jgi:3-hydroxyacyl-CoA dehydrogenase/enoyl-CoA hydratase/3-hydroxybutyryl-CoA epimerase